MDYVLLEILEVFKVYTWWNKIPLRKQRWHFNIKAVLNGKKQTLFSQISSGAFLSGLFY